MENNVLEECFKEYVASVYPSGIHKATLEHVQHAFVYGASITHMLVRKTLKHHLSTDVNTTAFNQVKPLLEAIVDLCDKTDRGETLEPLNAP